MGIELSSELRIFAATLIYLFILFEDLAYCQGIFQVVEESRTEIEDSVTQKIFSRFSFCTEKLHRPA